MRRFALGIFFVFFLYAGVAYAAVYSNDSNSVDINYTGPAPGSITPGTFPEGAGGGTQGDAGGAQGGNEPGSGGSTSGGQTGVTIPVGIETDTGGAGTSGGSTGTGQASGGAGQTDGGSAARTPEDLLSTLIGHTAVNFGLNSGSGGEWGTITISAKKAREALKSRGVSRLSLSDLLNSKFFTREDFTIVAASKILENKTIEEVILTLDTLTLTYSAEGRLFAVFPLSYPIKLTINPNLDTREKRVQVSFPWYRFFLQTFVSKSELQKQLDSAIGQAIVGADAGADVKTKVLVAVTQTIESRFDTVEGSVK